MEGSISLELPIRGPPTVNVLKPIVTHTHIQLPHFIGTKAEGDISNTTGPPTRGIQTEHLGQHEYIINIGNMGWGKGEKVHTHEGD